MSKLKWFNPFLCIVWIYRENDVIKSRGVTRLWKAYFIVITINVLGFLIDLTGVTDIKGDFYIVDI